jgi:hypothetical protein
MSHAARLRPGGALVAVAVALALAPRSARADRYEATIALRPAWGTARIWESGTNDYDDVRSRGLAASANLGMRDWLDLGAELVANYFDEASYDMVTLPISDNPHSGPIKRTSRTAQLRGTATFRYGVGWVPFTQLALGLGARHRTTAQIYSRTAMGPEWLLPDGQGEEVTLDVVAGVRAGLERRLTVHWTIGASAAVTHSLGVLRPDLQTLDVTFSFAYSWYPPLPR